MSIVKALQNGSKTFLGSNANVSINLGNGNANIAVTAKNAAIDTGCGDHNITAKTSGNLYVDTGCCGKDNVNAEVGGNAVIITRADDDVVQLDVKGNFYVDAGDKNTCCCESDNDTVLIKGNLDNTSGKNFVGLGDGTDNTRIIANNVDVAKDEGTNILGFYGDNYNIQSNAENNMIGFWGDNVNIDINGEGVQDIKTLDFSFEAGQFTDFGFQDLLEKETYMGKSVDTVVIDKLTGKNNIDEVAKQYNLTDAQTEQLKSLDLTKTTKNGQPYYLLYKDGDKYQIGYRDNSNNIYNMNGKKLNYANASSYTERSASDPNHWSRTVTNVSTASYTGSTNLDVEQEHEITTETRTTEYYNMTGVKNVNINFRKDGDYSVGITASDGYVNINGKDVTEQDATQNIVVRGSYILQNTEVDTDVKYIMEKLNLSSGNLTKTAYTNYGSWVYNSDPLILDINKDGAVSTYKSNYGDGVDIDGDGIGDGYAADGDKMLAMSDLNKNGKIDGAEVFGDKTVSPFTKKALNASNGFEALKMIAEEAEQYTGIECIEDGKVDIQKLAQALKKYGVTLGTIGGNNTTSVESLGDIQAIDTSYVDVKDAEGNIKHSQQAWYYTTDGQKYKADDVKF